MSAKECLIRLLEELPEERANQLLDYAYFLRHREEWEAWQRFGLSELAKAYGPEEPEYSLADIKPEPKP